MTGIFLDHNATTPIVPEALEAMQQVYSEPCNPSSVHSFGRHARKLLDEARARIAKTCSAEGATVIFTGSGTESNNLALHGLEDVQDIFISATEHVSIMKPADVKGASHIPVDENGLVRLGALERMLKNVDGKVLVSVMLANNETGVIQPIHDIAKLVYQYGGYMHTDASQVLGKIALDFTALNVDMMTISGHKFGGPVGAAALIMKTGLHIKAQLLGGGQESGYRPGTENVPAIVGMAKAAELAMPASSELRDYLEQEIKATAAEAMIFGENAGRLPNTTSIALPGMKAETQLINFDLAGIAVSAGSACSSGRVTTSHVLLAMGVEKDIAASAIRVSLGNNTTKEEVDSFLTVWKSNYNNTISSKEAA